ncbi:MAG: helix-turn-helix domain-containing protein [Sphingobacterium sp.]|uniref:helix-turn-helix domain-containing protein n=1 Tax=Sphingobacterium sp. JB170 TaxID=1434842 RepID=UPI000B355D6A|nr:AraC family transcriptional regulator [Sphingobacterium sp. JB170]
MKIYIKNMVCDRCKMAVESQLKQLGFTPVVVKLGEIEIKESELGSKKEQLINNLYQLGFELLENDKKAFVQQIKALIIEHIQQDHILRYNLSDYLAKQSGKSYAYISSVFKEVEGYTLEKYYIRQRIERVKELLSYAELNLNEIAYKLHYSSVAHLSTQFKQITGMSPTAYKKQNNHNRIPLDRV